ncbi:ribosomal RNA small subunit methyltransferase A [Candidatus Campbellbacteria bacterium RIFOXYC2_FULL_35_25]|uniref:Ribosomal RNA small subunit methyltransferase A n=1 Tax=Candidatus Campbellbacteria bacterium RIFOXYC2_FULL_35_25 TaxID=1797582 RepID=A0A1F5EHV3_9BACT|nr:MAG: ribosomal RNA small subunit methyltransferase A [Candidatus Campbellbacteria bacterium RIFOXYC2_FULL_35_25]
MQNKKTLGQNFLKSGNIINKIVETADISDNDFILEIGPGKGVLTEKLLDKAGKVIVVEKDIRLISYLEEKFENYIKKDKLKVIYGDILDFEAKDIFLKEDYKIVANIPYYITGKIVKKFLSEKKQPTMMVLMVQKEVAKRITQLPESILSISVKIYGDPKYVKTVKAENFSPKPKVDSAILLINNISKNFFKEEKEGEKHKKIAEKDFFYLVKAGFSHKRKTLINNLITDYDEKKELNKEILNKSFQELNFSPKIRAENLSKNDWKSLFIKIN